jgi:hypothetical protein
MLCKYKDLLGKPGTGLHKYRFLGMAVVDWILTAVLAWSIAWWRGWNFLETFLGVFLVGELLHVLFCVPTAFLEYMNSVL